MLTNFNIWLIFIYKEKTKNHSIFLYLQLLSSSSVTSLVKGLPEALQRQYDYEDPIVRAGKHLMHSPFFKVCKI